MFVCFLSSAWWFLVMSFEVFLVFLNLLFLLLVSPLPSKLLSLWFPSPRHKRILFSSSLCSIVESWNYSRNIHEMTGLHYRTSSSCSQESLPSLSGLILLSLRKMYSRSENSSIHFFFFLCKNRKTYLSFLINLPDDDGICTSTKDSLKSSFSRVYSLFVNEAPLCVLTKDDLSW